MHLPVKLIEFFGCDSPRSPNVSLSVHPSVTLAKTVLDFLRTSEGLPKDFGLYGLKNLLVYKSQPLGLRDLLIFLFWFFSCQCPSTQSCKFWATRSAYNVHIFRCQSSDNTNFSLPSLNSRRKRDASRDLMSWRHFYMEIIVPDRWAVMFLVWLLIWVKSNSFVLFLNILHFIEWNYPRDSKILFVSSKKSDYFTFSDQSVKANLL